LGSKTIVEQMPIYLRFNENDVNEQDNKVMFNVLVCKLLAVVL
jgi:hypothetical protein